MVEFDQLDGITVQVGCMHEALDAGPRARGQRSPRRLRRVQLRMSLLPAGRGASGLPGGHEVQGRWRRIRRPGQSHLLAWLAVRRWRRWRWCAHRRRRPVGPRLRRGCRRGRPASRRRGLRTPSGRFRTGRLRGQGLLLLHRPFGLANGGDELLVLGAPTVLCAGVFALRAPVTRGRWRLRGAFSRLLRLLGATRRRLRQRAVWSAGPRLLELGADGGVLLDALVVEAARTEGAPHPAIGHPRWMQAAGVKGPFFAANPERGAVRGQLCRSRSSGFASLHVIVHGRLGHLETTIHALHDGRLLPFPTCFLVEAQRRRKEHLAAQLTWHRAGPHPRPRDGRRRCGAGAGSRAEA
mmetsp:Transcript_115028/g.330466  ORF Transcript_115028/g.330466 Transcript_115028/m.330466 type:complete len:353 (+) Transcript_115028:1403-2461(+)